MLFSVLAPAHRCLLVLQDLVAEAMTSPSVEQFIIHRKTAADKHKNCHIFAHTGNDDLSNL